LPLTIDRIAYARDEERPGQAEQAFSFGDASAPGFAGAEDGDVGVQSHAHEFPGFDPAVVLARAGEHYARVQGVLRIHDAVGGYVDDARRGFGVNAADVGEEEVAGGVDGEGRIEGE
jgi:hypothetical protein